MPKIREIAPILRNRQARKRLRTMCDQAKSKGDFGEWRRCKAVLDFIEGKTVAVIAKDLDTGRSSVYVWLDRYEAEGTEGLKTFVPPGAAPRLDAEQEAELVAIIEAGPVAAGYHTGVWTGPMIGDLIEKHFGVRYHNHHIPRLLHRLGFSVQRPRKKLAKADAEAQEYWLRKKLPAIKKKPDDAVVS